MKKNQKVVKHKQKAHDLPVAVKHATRGIFAGTGSFLANTVEGRGLPSFRLRSGAVGRFFSSGFSVSSEGSTSMGKRKGVKRFLWSVPRQREI